MSIELISLFSVPIIKFRFTKHNQYRFPSIARSERIPNGWDLSLNSSFPFIEDDDPLVNPQTRDNLQKDILSDITKVLTKLKISSGVKYGTFWYNVYHENQGQELHDHLAGAGEVNDYWSGIYYNKNATPTRFHNTHKYMKTCTPPMISEDSVMSKYYNDMYLPPVEDGDVILFPPWVNHEVVPDPNQKQMRLTFSFNLSYTSDNPQ
jgi:hypothetical protein